MYKMKVIILTFFAICCAQVKSFDMLSEIIENFPNQCSADINRGPFVQVGQKYYFIEATKELTWFAAAHFCRTMDAHLVTIETAVEMDAMSKHLRAQGLTKWFWTSGNDLGSEGKHEWLGTGKPMYYTKWDVYEPNNEFGNENCVHLRHNGYDYLMNDVPCTEVGSYICEASQPKSIAITFL